MSKNNSPTLRDLLAASAGGRSYPYVDRAAIWEERLALHLKDIETINGAPQVGDMITLPERAETETRRPAGAFVGSARKGDDIGFMGIADIARLVRKKELSPVEIAETMLARIDQKRDQKAFITVKPERVLDQARALERRIGKGEDVGPLAGAPVAAKDLMYVAGHPFTCGTKAMPGDVADSDAMCVANLRGAGALILGTTNLHELAYGVTSANVHFGHVVNPIAPGHIPGGSSGGSGAAVAGGLAVMGIGTDTGGSIRIPAACCGVVGFKPSYEAVSREGVWALAWSLDHIGPLARTVDDAALSFEAMAALRPGSVSGHRIDRPRLIQPMPFFFDHLDDVIRTHIDGVFGKLTGAGATLEERYVEGVEYAPSTQWMTLASEACQSNWELLINKPEGISPDVRLRLEVGQFIAAIDYIKAQRLRRWLRDNMLEAMQDADVFVMPTLPLSIPKQGLTTIEIGGRVLPVPTAVTRLTSPFNFTGLPAVSLPCGLDSNGLPVGLQIIGRPGADATVLAVARWCEGVLAGTKGRA